MSLYADILSGEYAYDNDVRQDGDTWTVIAWELNGEEIPGVPSKDLAFAIVRAIRAGYRQGDEAGRCDF